MKDPDFSEQALQFLLGQDTQSSANFTYNFFKPSKKDVSTQKQARKKAQYKAHAQCLRGEYTNLQLLLFPGKNFASRKCILLEIKNRLAPIQNNAPTHSIDQRTSNPSPSYQPSLPSLRQKRAQYEKQYKNDVISLFKEIRKLLPGESETFMSQMEILKASKEVLQKKCKNHDFSVVNDDIITHNRNLFFR